MGLLRVVVLLQVTVLLRVVAVLRWGAARRPITSSAALVGSQSFRPTSVSQLTSSHVHLCHPPAVEVFVLRHLLYLNLSWLHKGARVPCLMYTLLLLVITSIS